MSLLNVLQYPDSFLLKKAHKVENIDENILNLVENMKETMYENSGMGLAAVQVGEDVRIIVYDTEENKKQQRNPHVIINPEIISQSGTAVSAKEGCLSVPGLRADVTRASNVSVKGIDIEGKPINFDATGMLAFVMQHEIDHLNGILFIEKISPLKRKLYKKKVQKKNKYADS